MADQESGSVDGLGLAEAIESLRDDLLKAGQPAPPRRSSCRWSP